MDLWNIVETEEFIAALGKLPKTSAVTDVIAELYERLKTNAGQGEGSGNQLQVIKSAPKEGQRHPAIRMFYEIDAPAHQVLLRDIQSADAPRPPRPPRDNRA